MPQYPFYVRIKLAFILKSSNSEKCTENILTDGGTNLSFVFLFLFFFANVIQLPFCESCCYFCLCSGSREREIEVVFFVCVLVDGEGDGDGEEGFEIMEKCLMGSGVFRTG